MLIHSTVVPVIQKYSHSIKVGNNFSFLSVVDDLCDQRELNDIASMHASIFQLAKSQYNKGPGRQVTFTISTT